MPGRTLVLAVAALALTASVSADEALRRTPVVRAVEKAGPAVVNISTERIVVQTLRDPFVDPSFEEFFGRIQPQQRKVRTSSLGSGVLIDPEGYVLTNEHVIRKASQIHVTLADGTACEAALVASDRAADLALCKIAAPHPLPFVSLDACPALMIGESAIALGNPFGLENSVTVGVISAKDRALASEGRVAYADLVQTDASINPGNSGGPLLNLDAELIGINTAIYSQAEGIGFAIPASRVRRVLGEMMGSLKDRKGWTGLGLDRVRRGDAARIEVASVEADSPAAQAGIRPGDEVLEISGQPAPGFFGCLKLLASVHAGQSLALGLRRDGKAVAVSLPVAEPPHPTPEALLRARLGLGVQASTPEVAERLGLGDARGCLVTAVVPSGPAARAGLEPGDLLLRVGRRPVPEPSALAEALEAFSAGEEIPVQVVRDGRIYAASIVVVAPGGRERAK